MSETTARPSLEGLRIPRDEQPRPSLAKRFIWPSISTLCVVGVLTAMAVVFWPASTTEVRVEPVRLSSAGGAASVLDASGYVTARRSATVSSKRTGRIRKVLVEEGMAVVEGQVVAELDDAAELAQLRLAEAQLASARSALGETRAELHEAELAFGRMSELNAQGPGQRSGTGRRQGCARSLERPPRIQSGGCDRSGASSGGAASGAQ